ncbi:S8 family serine peptidase [Sorangium sp. So ce136]|uniref:S8 family peptidase n=1 Tax=Sorangium sp. So ce136 TaxID=3133284 RepID=UPI003F0D3EF4
MRRTVWIAAAALSGGGCAVEGDQRDEVLAEQGASLTTPNDPLLCERPDFGPISPEHIATYQWAHGCHAAFDAHDIGTRGAWDVTTGHATIGFLDGGVATFHRGSADLVIDAVHPDLAPAFREHLSPSWGIDARAGRGFDTTPFGHGMHTMGIAAARGNDALGVAGVCWGCSTLLGNIGIGHVVSQGSAPPTATLFGRLVAAGAQVINMSLSIPAAAQAAFAEQLSFAVRRDVVVVAAAGNDGRNGDKDPGNVDYPARDPAVIGVAGSDHTGGRWNESASYPREAATNFGAGVAIAAPANSVLSSFYPGNSSETAVPLTQPPCGDHHPLGSSAPNDGYGICSGTSMSSPLVAGVAALVRSVNPLLSAADVRAALTATAAPRPGLGLGAGIVDADRAVRVPLARAGGREIAQRLTPLFSLYSPGATDSLYTTVPQVAAAAIQDTGRRKYSSATPAVIGAPVAYTSRMADPAVPGYSAFPDGAGQSPRAAVFVFTTNHNPLTGARDLVPLYRMSYVGDWAGNADHRDHTYTTDARGIAAYAAVGYKLDGIEGYVFPSTLASPPPGTVRLLRRYSRARDDHAIFPEAQLAAMEAEGYTETSGNAFIGYVYPNQDTDADGLMDGFERLLGTSPTVADTDCDGHADGDEVPLARVPARDPLAGPCSR